MAMLSERLASSTETRSTVESDDTPDGTNETALGALLAAKSDSRAVKSTLSGAERVATSVHSSVAAPSAALTGFQNNGFSFASVGLRYRYVAADVSTSAEPAVAVRA